jgi:hypothetical protein
MKKSTSSGLEPVYHKCQSHTRPYPGLTEWELQHNNVYWKVKGKITPVLAHHTIASNGFMSIYCLAYPSVVKMKAVCSCETSVHFKQNTWRYIPEDRTLHNHRCANFKSDNMGRADVKLHGFIAALNEGELPHSPSGRFTPGTQFRLGGSQSCSGHGSEENIPCFCQYSGPDRPAHSCHNLLAFSKVFSLNWPNQYWVYIRSLGNRLRLSSGVSSASCVITTEYARGCPRATNFIFTRLRPEKTSLRTVAVKASNHI